MKTKTMLLAVAALALLAIPAMAQTAVPAVVEFSTIADMQTLRDSKKQDVFTVTLKDAQISTKIEQVCSAGRTELLFVRKDKICAFQRGSEGAVFNPRSNQWLPRTQYQGSYTVTADGTTEADSLSVNYLTLGTVAASNDQFKGSLNLKPELSSSGAAALTKVVLDKLGQGSDGLTNSAVDTIDLNRLFVPSAGLPSDKGCTWNGNMLFSYQTYSWYVDVTADCNGKSYALKGNMPFTDTPGVEGQSQYDLTLTLPSASLVGDDALFASGGEGDLFAVADGITGQIVMKNSQFVTVKVDGEEISTPAKVDATGTFTGNNVPLELVRSWATLIALLPSTFFGA